MWLEHTKGVCLEGEVSRQEELGSGGEVLQPQGGRTRAPKEMVERHQDEAFVSNPEVFSQFCGVLRGSTKSLGAI